MPEIIGRRVSGEISGGFVLFLIGVRINRPWKVSSWMPVVSAMPRMLKELAQKPELGLLHHRLHFGFPNMMVVQYWRNFDLLNAYAHARNHEHLPAWAAFNKDIGTNGDVGIWHETYVIEEGKSASIYINMPKFGIGAAGEIFESTGARVSAEKRLTPKS